MKQKTQQEPPDEELLALGSSIAAQTGPTAEEGEVEDVHEHAAFLYALFVELQRRRRAKPEVGQ